MMPAEPSSANGCRFRGISGKPRNRPLLLHGKHWRSIRSAVAEIRMRGSWPGYCRERGKRRGIRTRAATRLLGSKLHLTTELDHSVRRNAKKVRRGKRVAMHGLEQLAADGVKVRLPFRYDLRPADEKG